MENGFKLYKFRYKDAPEKGTFVGVMAQDLLETHPESVIRDESEYYAVRHELLGLRMMPF